MKIPTPYSCKRIGFEITGVICISDSGMFLISDTQFIVFDLEYQDE
ncbi:MULTISPECIES: hypothetical protein [Croceitalea]|uniref:Uncharacterized protein n=1 Tax=Croceitalea vernalis TaxID=3075599 RepID=A0ABU3BG82_9FLAO|nr:MULTISPECIES: hypothetical protein [unclassified Croceitalea]MDT0539391.1 hypothetical protein [Croceitalea sp. P059]MDT0621184.1 hypothetical protein [Croceitalea sp. P007]